MAQIELKNPQDLQGWTFDTPEELTGFLNGDFATDHNLTGNIISYDNQGVTVWRLTLNVPGEPRVHVYLTSAVDPAAQTWLVHDGVSLRSYTEAEFDARYQVVE